jgi:diguanylate cyclase (GGDEF)-like protein
MNLDEAILQLEKIVAQIRQATFADDKTPLGNSLALSKEIESIEVGQNDYNIIVFGDLNDFKSLNDIHGHEAGDIAIRQVGATIQKQFIEELGAKAFRQSGDEFVILLKQELLEAFQNKVSIFESIAFSHKGKSLEAKMSFGFVVSDGKTDFSDLMERAETACRIAKNQGNGVCIRWDETVEQYSYKEFRFNCRHCGSLNKCNVPKRHKPETLAFCSFCGKNFNNSSNKRKRAD